MLLIGQCCLFYLTFELFNGIIQVKIENGLLKGVKRDENFFKSDDINNGIK